MVGLWQRRSSRLVVQGCSAPSTYISKPYPCCPCKTPRPLTRVLVVTKKKRKLLPFTPSEDPKRRLEHVASLASASTGTKAEFSNEFTYMAGMAPRSANCPALEQGRMQETCVEVLWNSVVVEAYGEEKGRVLGGIKVKNVVTRDVFDLKVSGLFFTIRHEPDMIPGFETLCAAEFNCRFVLDYSK